jgi:predicted protein tyrosine phosphatase
MQEKPNIIFVCGRNKKRSKTAGQIFRNDHRFSVRSAGVSAKSNHQINGNDIEWADHILVMERRYGKRIAETFRDYHLPPIETLEIDDIYEYMDETLIQLLESSVNDYLNSIN